VGGHELLSLGREHLGFGGELGRFGLGQQAADRLENLGSVASGHPAIFPSLLLLLLPKESRPDVARGLRPMLTPR
jgi:hypothetical protein